MWWQRTLGKQMVISFMLPHMIQLWLHIHHTTYVCNICIYWQLVKNKLVEEAAWNELVEEFLSMTVFGCSDLHLHVGSLDRTCKIFDSINSVRHNEIKRDIYSNSFVGFSSSLSVKEKEERSFQTTFFLYIIQSEKHQFLCTIIKAGGARSLYREIIAYY